MKDLKKTIPVIDVSLLVDGKDFSNNINDRCIFSNECMNLEKNYNLVYYVGTESYINIFDFVYTTDRNLNKDSNSFVLIVDENKMHLLFCELAAISDCSIDELLFISSCENKLSIAKNIGINCIMIENKTVKTNEEIIKTKTRLDQRNCCLAFNYNYKNTK